MPCGVQDHPGCAFLRMSHAAVIRTTAAKLATSAHHGLAALAAREALRSYCSLQAPGCACSCQSFSYGGRFRTWCRLPRTSEQCMAQAAFSGYCLERLYLSRTPYLQQPLPSSKQVAAPTTSSGKSLRLQAHAYNSQRAASKSQTPSHIVIKGFQAVKRHHYCSSSVGCFAQNCSADSQVPGNGHSSIPTTAVQVCHLYMLHLHAVHHIPVHLCTLAHMNLQGHPPFLKVPWDWKEVASVSSFFCFLFFYELGACHNAEQIQFVSNQGAMTTTCPEQLALCRCCCYG